MSLPSAKTIFESGLTGITETPLSVQAAASCLVARATKRESTVPLDRLDKALIGILRSGEPSFLTRAYLLADNGAGELSRAQLIETAALIAQEFHTTTGNA
jgi:hypothetical protein